MFQRPRDQRDNHRLFRSVGFKRMPCRECGLFAGEPLCSACRALGRIKAVLSLRHLSPSQEGTVVGILRDAAGAIQDLSEVATASGALAPVGTAGLGGLSGGQTPVAEPEGGGEAESKKKPEVKIEVPSPKVEKKDEKKERGAHRAEVVVPPPREEESKPIAESSPSEEKSTTEEECEEIEEETEIVDKRTDLRSQEPPIYRGSVGRYLKHGSTQPAGLTPTGKASARVSRSREERKRRDREPDPPQDGASGSGGHGDHSRARVPRSPSRPPKRNRTRSKSKERKAQKSKGKKKRERRQHYKEWSHHSTGRYPAGWHQSWQRGPRREEGR